MVSQIGSKSLRFRFQVEDAKARLFLPRRGCYGGV
jgi:hypothetical protein